MRTAGAICALTFFLLASAANAADYRDLNLYFGAGQSPIGLRGHSVFRTVTLELTAHSKLIDRWLPNTEAGASLSYSKIRQARSWFGYQYGDPDDHVRAETSYFFLRHNWREASTWRPYLELGTGPMWSNRRVPAATSRFNFDSQLGFGVALGARSPWRIGYRFQHISNAGTAGRNPGLEVHSFLLGVRIRDLRK